MAEDVQMKIRVPKSLHDKLRRVGIRNGRSISAEVIFRLSASDGPNEQLERIERAIGRIEQQVTTTVA